MTQGRSGCDPDLIDLAKRHVRQCFDAIDRSKKRLRESRRLRHVGYWEQIVKMDTDALHVALFYWGDVCE